MFSIDPGMMEALGVVFDVEGESGNANDRGGIETCRGIDQIAKPLTTKVKNAYLKNMICDEDKESSDFWTTECLGLCHKIAY